MRLSDWLSCEVIGSFLRQFPQKHRVEAARCACRIGVLCLWGWTTSQKQWSLEDLLEVTASINPIHSNGGMRTSTPREVNRRSEVVAQPWAAAQAPEPRGVSPKEARPPPVQESAAPTWTGERSASSQQGRSPGLNSSRRYGSEETLKTLNQRPSRSAQNARLPLRAVGSSVSNRRRGTSQDSAPPSAPASAKDLRIHPDGSTASLPEARRPMTSGRPLVTFTATGARRAPATGTAAATATATASGPALSSVAASTVPRRATVQRMVPPQASPNQGHRGRNGFRRVSSSSLGASRERQSSPSGSPGTPRTSTEPTVALGGRVFAGTLGGAHALSKVSALKRHTLGGTLNASRR